MVGISLHSWSFFLPQSLFELDPVPPSLCPDAILSEIEIPSPKVKKNNKTKHVLNKKISLRELFYSDINY